MGQYTDFTRSLHHLVALMEHETDQLLLEQLGIGFAQYKILNILSQHERVQQKAIASELGQTEASISRQIKLLQAANMILMRVNAKNKREHLCELTDRGQRTVLAADAILAKYHDGVAAGLGEKQQKQLDEHLAALHDAICGPARHISSMRNSLSMEAL